MRDHTLKTDQSRPFRAYSPYGACPDLGASCMAFNGEFLDACTGSYLLGNGKRAYSPTLGRFLSADKLSPFAKGGVNAYVYCLDDPINRQDPSGEFSLFNVLVGLKKVFWVLARIKNFGWGNGTLKAVGELAKYGDKLGGAMTVAGIPGGRQVLTASLGVSVAVKAIKVVPAVVRTIRVPSATLHAVGRRPF